MVPFPFTDKQAQMIYILKDLPLVNFIENVYVSNPIIFQNIPILTD